MRLLTSGECSGGVLRIYMHELGAHQGKQLYVHSCGALMLIHHGTALTSAMQVQLRAGTKGYNHRLSNPQNKPIF